MRAFVAIDLPEEAKILLSNSISDGNGLRRVSQMQLHLTLSFLGDISEREADEVKGVLSGITQRCFNMSLKGIGSFMNGDHGVIFTSVDEGKEELQQISNELRSGLRTLRIRTEDRKFMPHITIARVNEVDRNKEIVENYMKSNSVKRFGSFLCREIKLKKSILTSSGPLYEDLFVKELDCS